MIKTNKVYDAYWQFAYNRQNAFLNRYYGYDQPWVQDAIIQTYKFTNAYRVLDRVSQYLIKNVIYRQGDYTSDDIVFRILLFKVFNKIETWQYLEECLGDIRYSNFNEAKYCELLEELISNNKRIYSAAYIMPSGTSAFGFSQKHKNNLALLRFMMEDGVPSKLARARSLKEVYEILLFYPTIGPFLAFQYAIDINYSELCDFSEMSFVVAGPGAQSGIRKCFNNSGHSDEYLIRWTAEHQYEEFFRRGLNFPTLYGRELQLIDCQNLFCETDKYSRVLFPEIEGKHNRTKIKQKFTPNNQKIELFFPPKWDIRTEGEIANGIFNKR